MLRLLNRRYAICTVTDLFRDGMCCDAGNGYYDIDVQKEDGSWRSAVRGSKFFGAKSHMIGEHTYTHIDSDTIDWFLTFFMIENRSQRRWANRVYYVGSR